MRVIDEIWELDKLLELENCSLWLQEVRQGKNFGFIIITIIKLSLNWSFLLFEQIIKFMIVLTSTIFSR